MRQIIKILALFFTFCVCPAHAEQATLSSSTQIEPKVLDAAKEAVHLMYGGQDYAKSLEARMDSYVSLTLRDNPSKKEIIQKLIEETFIPGFMAHEGEFEDMSAEIYAKNFTYDELKDILVFMKSPVGRKLQAIKPELLNQGNEMARPLRERLNGDGRQKFIQALEDNSLNVPKELAVWEKDKP
jgi:hypothetical protein